MRFETRKWRRQPRHLGQHVQVPPPVRGWRAKPAAFCGQINKARDFGQELEGLGYQAGISIDQYEIICPLCPSAFSPQPLNGDLSVSRARSGF